MMEWKEELQQHTKEAEKIVQGYLPEETGHQKLLIEASNYSVLVGGKRLRPMIMLESFKAFDGTGNVVEPFMAALEMIHSGSLVHDDLPCMDNDEYRRGNLTTWKKYGYDMAVLAGDKLFIYAFETAAKAFDGTNKDIQTAKALQILTRKPGIYGMIGGQTVDVEQENKAISFDTLMYIHNNKTAALIECAMMVGAVLAGADEASVKTIEAIARKTGLAFQIEDDILDVTSSLEVLGKPIHSDEKNEKTTYVTLYGIEGAQKEVERLSAEAIDSLRKLGGADTFLEALLVYLIHRKK